jgi:hypothetical protein
MSQENKLNAAIEASVLEEMMDDATHQVEFSSFCLKHYLNLDDENIDRITLLCENLSVNQKLYEFSSKVLTDNPVDEVSRLILLDEANMFVMETLVLTKISLQTDLRRYANVSIEEN